MPRLFLEKSLILATYNKGKLHEIKKLLAQFRIHIVPVESLGLAESAETGKTFADNATAKAVEAAKVVGLPAIADDSGLVVTALGGAPGLYSARWAREERSFIAAMIRIHTLLGDTKDRSACFVSALALAWPDGHTETFEGVVQGKIVWPPRGRNGFGYDPIFQPSGHTATFAEMDPTFKQTISHRTRAFYKLAAACLQSS